ncbi:pleckstrin homology domain-containing family G member 3 isoform X2 [Dunckerocampus dactyliophorus]|uniref:pleckstrin homology domain-containing family G member 3 isoform X2 n=1 Tax=Dunckerocampus dactyliophorus TaxID=161453 RepID=UPI002406BEFE|nr:pleckstrin homology domain-containing family G member 3 isoform X2 [Dunckerocampus dactyliophorus]
MPEGSRSALHQGPMGEEYPQLPSPLSTGGGHKQVNTDLGRDCYSQLCAEPLDSRPVSLVSTLSSGSSRDSHSLFGSTMTLPSSSTPPIPSEEDIDLELSPTESTIEQTRNQSPGLAGSSGLWQPHLIGNQWNNNATSNRKARAEILHTTASPVVMDTMAPNPKLTYMDRVVMEIIETERMYVRDLRSIVEDYLAHIIDTSNDSIRPELVCALFGNIEDIYEFNSELLQSLDMCENDPVAIAQCFVDKSEYFEIYTQYCTNYPNSVAALTDCMRNKSLAKFFKDRQAALKRSLPLGSFLLKPVQRILKYHLLLQEIAKHFDQDQVGYEVIQEAIDTMTGVAWYINDMKRKHEHAVRVQEIQSLLINWKGPDLTTCGELVLEGTFHVLRAKNTRTLFLFEKMLLITKRRGEHYVYKTHIVCSTLMLLDSAKDPLLFSVIHFKHPKQPHTVQAKSVEEKRLWSHHIKRLILENHNTIVPPKAKETIMDSSNCPERLKRADSYHSEDFHLAGRNGRRRSEPAKQIMKSTKDVMKDDPLSDAAQLSDNEKTETEDAPSHEETQKVHLDELHSLNCLPEIERNPQLLARKPQHPCSPLSSQTQEDVTPEPVETSGETGEEEEGGSDSSGLQLEETSVLISSELSEEEEEEVLAGSKSILPCSVLDQASVIAERFISGLSRRSSLITDDLDPLACASPLTPNSVFISPSTCTNSEETPQASSPEPQVTSEADTPVHELDVERRSTLSKQDRILIHKIRRYYEHAENQDANFSIKRRESLSYIPVGLVRHLSRQLNNIPDQHVVPLHRKVLSRHRPTSWSVFDLPGLEKSPNMDFHQRPKEVKMRSPSVTDSFTTDEDFRPSSEMMKVWQDVESAMEVQQSEEEEKAHGECLDSMQPPPILEESETSPVLDSSSISEVDRNSHQDCKPHKASVTQGKNLVQLPRIISFRASVDEDQILQDMGKMKNKVFQLARQYSQRIKSNRPMVWQRNREASGPQGFRNMPAVPEEKVKKKGKPNLRLPLNICEQMVIHEVNSPSPAQTPSSGASSHSAATGSQSPQSENFHWPDVQELRSKYNPCRLDTDTAHASKRSLECSTDKCNGCSHTDPDEVTHCPAAQSETWYEERGEQEWPRPRSKMLCRWSSLDHMLGSYPLNEVQNLQEHVPTCCSTGQMSLTAQEGSVLTEAEELLQDSRDCPAKSAGPSSAKMSERNLVKSLLERFQSLSTSS